VQFHKEEQTEIGISPMIGIWASRLGINNFTRKSTAFQSRNGRVIPAEGGGYLYKDWGNYQMQILQELTYSCVFASEKRRVYAGFVTWFHPMALKSTKF